MAGKPKRDLPLQKQSDSKPAPDDGQIAESGTQRQSKGPPRISTQAAPCLSTETAKPAKPLTFRQRVSRQGEQVAVEYLEARGYRVLHRNWRSGRFTEVDLIACDPQGLITLVEVKTRQWVPVRGGTTFSGYENGLEAIDWRKKEKR